MRGTPGEVCLILGQSTHSEGEPGDGLGTKAVLQAVEDIETPVADDFTQPSVAIDVDEQGAAGQASRLGMGGHGRVDEVIPDPDDFGLLLAAIHAQLTEDPWEDIGG